MNAERLCQCGGLYLAASGYDYSCPDCWRDECEAAVRTVEWIGGMEPPGMMLVERTPITWTQAQAVAFLAGPYSGKRYALLGQIVPCLVGQLRRPWCRHYPADHIDADTICSHPHRQMGYRHRGQLHTPCGYGWWILDTEVAWVADPSEINCHEENCCLAH